MAVASQIWYWPYELHSRNVLNAVSQRRSFHGALIRVDDGYGCIHPWPELGDLPLEQQLDGLKSGTHTNLVKQALLCASLDREARHRGESLYQRSNTLPMNHWLWQSGDQIEQLVAGGFQRVKLKIGPELLPVDLLSQFQKAGLLIRLDANESLDFTTISEWWRSLSDSVRAAIEFVEDPISWDTNRWAELRKIGIPIAADRDVCSRIDEADWAVVKPATDAVDECRSTKVVFTSYMDHPVGQVWAASQAQSFYKIQPAQTCGLLTHTCFEKNEFSERMIVKDTSLLPPEGTGIGFDDLLAQLPWRRLI